MKKIVLVLSLLMLLIGGYFFIFDLPFVRCTGGFQVVVKRQHLLTKEIRDFPTPCHVPLGWTEHIIWPFD